MGKIRHLPPELANQIAAGEVVERPAAVVKELIENALDAGARHVNVAIEFGGKRRIRVEDDGEGMDRTDARLALERHATSKISTVDDLGLIRTLGFRGEALPSIGSVSRLVLRTRARGAPTGTQIRVTGGRLEEAGEIGAPEGTVVDVSDLFFNVPARRKFLKADTAEAAQVSRIVTRLALAYPEVGFNLTSRGRPVLRCPPVRTLRDRLYQLNGERPDLVSVQKTAAGIHVTGYIAALAADGPVRGPQNVFVNRRIVKDRTIAHAIVQAYSVASIKERSPEVHLLIEMPADRVDVNVHPTKAEVRFLEQSLVHEVVRRALTEALGEPPPPELSLQASVSSQPAATMGLPGLLASAGVANRWVTAAGTLTRAPDAVADRSHGSLPSPDTSVPANGPTDGEGRSGADVPLYPMVPLGQFRNTFILAVDQEGVSIIDQHVAHERILYEQVVERLATGTLESQRLLDPVILDLAPAQRQALASHASDLQRLGFEVEEFGGDSVKVAAVPAVLGLRTCTAAIRHLAEDLEGLDRGSGVQDALQRIAATTACHAAVKANDPLSLEKMRYLLDELRRTAYSTVCPHGRPVVLRLTRREIERNFQRI